MEWVSGVFPPRCERYLQRTTMIIKPYPNVKCDVPAHNAGMHGLAVIDRCEKRLYAMVCTIDKGSSHDHSNGRVPHRYSRRHVPV